jgi:predicted  nucleic acid-binding Zn-ribbon protein
MRGLLLQEAGTRGAAQVVDPAVEDGAHQEASERGRAPRSALQRLASFRFAYIAIFVFLIAYVFSIEALEAVLQGHFEEEIAAAVRVDPGDGPVPLQIEEEVSALLRSSPWIRYGDVRVRPLILGADGRTLIFAGGGFPPLLLDEGDDGRGLLPALVDVEVAVPHNALASNAVLVLYAALLVTTLAIYTRRLTAREQLQLDELSTARDAAAERAGSIESELDVVRARLDEVEPENELYAEEIDSLAGERRQLMSRLAELEAREGELRRKSSRAQELEQESRTLEELLEEATRDLDARDEQIIQLQSQVKRSDGGGKGGSKPAELLERRFRALYKNLEVDSHAIQNLVALRDEGWKLRAEEALKTLSDDPDKAVVRRKVGGLPPHLSIFELGFAGKGRLYYTRGRARSYRILAIGAKNSQKTDLEYLSRLPKGT